MPARGPLSPDRDRDARRATPLLAVLVLAAAYAALVLGLGTLTGNPTWDGIAGVVVGLYVCSHPAANAVDVIFYSRGLRGAWSRWSTLRWLLLNAVVVVAGWLVIVFGATRLVR